MSPDVLAEFICGGYDRNSYNESQCDELFTILVYYLFFLNKLRKRRTRRGTDTVSGIF